MTLGELIAHHQALVNEKLGRTLALCTLLSVCPVEDAGAAGEWAEGRPAADIDTAARAIAAGATMAEVIDYGPRVALGFATADRPGEVAN